MQALVEHYSSKGWLQRVEQTGSAHLTLVVPSLNE
jgi:hypothetical protein